MSNSSSSTTETTRADHLAWCKQRAFEVLDSGDLQGAFSSMVSDCNAHPETKDHSGAELGMMMMMGGHLSTESEMRRFIDGFN